VEWGGTPLNSLIFGTGKGTSSSIYYNTGRSSSTDPHLNGLFEVWNEFENRYPDLPPFAREIHEFGFLGNQYNQKRGAYNNRLGGLKVLNYGAQTGSLTVDGGEGVIDMNDDGLYGARLYVANADSNAADSVVQAGAATKLVKKADSFAIWSRCGVFTSGLFYPMSPLFFHSTPAHGFH